MLLLINFTKKVPRYPGKKAPSINYPYFTKSFKFFAVKLRLLRKSSDIWLLGVINTTLVLRFMTSNKFYFVQTAEVVNVFVIKDSLFSFPRLGIFAHFSNSNFLVIVFINEIREPTGLELVHI